MTDIFWHDLTRQGNMCVSLQWLAIRDLNNWVIQELLLADLAKTQKPRDDEGPYSRINLDQHR